MGEVVTVLLFNWPIPFRREVDETTFALLEKASFTCTSGSMKLLKLGFPSILIWRMRPGRSWSLQAAKIADHKTLGKFGAFLLDADFGLQEKLMINNGDRCSVSNDSPGF